jgi:ribosome maturation factor RimP
MNETDKINENEAEETSSAASGSENWREKVSRMAAEVAAREGCEIYDFEFSGGASGRVLRVFIDKVGEGGVSIDDCSNVSRGLNLLLDVDDVIPGGAYNLEVSSPGLERPLRTAVHFERAAGKRAHVKTFDTFAELSVGLEDADKAKLGKAKQLEGMIVGTEAVSASADRALIVFDAESGGSVIRVRLPLDKITKANTIFIFETNEKPSGSKAKKKR